jgi:hypothetical protein
MVSENNEAKCMEYLIRQKSCIPGLGF